MRIVVKVTPIAVSLTRCRRRKAPQKHDWCANIILATANGYGTTETTRRSGKAKPVVGLALAGAVHSQGIAGLTRDKTTAVAGTHRAAG